MAQTYAKLSNDFWRNTKIRKLARLNLEAVGIYVLILSYCSSELTDGRISEDELTYQLNADEQHVAILCEIGFLERTEDGYQVHDYLAYQTSREQVEAKSSSARTRVRRTREKKIDNVESNVSEPRGDESDVALQERYTNESEALHECYNSDGEALHECYSDACNARVTPVFADCNAPVRDNTEYRIQNTEKEKTSFFPNAHERAKKTRIPRDFQPDIESRAHAQALNLDPDAEAKRFTDWWRADGGKRADWQATFRGWCSNSPAAKPAKPAKRDLPSEAWVSRHVVEPVPADRQFEARRRFVALFREGLSAEDAAARTLTEYGVSPA